MSTPRPISPAYPPPRPPGMPVWVKWLIGCGIGCAVLIMIGVGAAVFVGWWITSPGKQVATERIIAPDANGVVHFSGDMALSECAELLGHIMTRIQEEQNRQTGAQLPEGLRWLEEMQRQQQMQGASAGMAVWVPREVTLVLYGGDAQQDRSFVVAANFRQFVRLFRTIVKAAIQANHPDDPARMIHHNDYEIMGDEDMVLCFAGGTVLFANDLDRMRDTLDRLDQEDLEAIEPQSVFAGFDQLKESWPLIGILPNQGDGLVAELIAGSNLVDFDLEPGMVEAPEDVAQQAVAEVAEMHFGLGLESADVLRGELQVFLKGEDASDGVKRYLERRGEALREWAREKGLEPHGEITVQSRSVHQELRLSGLKALVDRSIEESFEIADKGES